MTSKFRIQVSLYLWNRNVLRLHFVVIGGIVDHHCLSFLFMAFKFRIQPLLGYKIKKFTDYTYSTTLCDKVCQCWFSPVSFTNKTDRHDITEILLKVALNTIIKLTTNKQFNSYSR
jgi:hypothetical protein